MPGWLAAVIVAEFVAGSYSALRRLSEVDTQEELDRRWAIFLATPFVMLTSIVVGVLVHVLVVWAVS